MPSDHGVTEQQCRARGVREVRHQERTAKNAIDARVASQPIEHRKAEEGTTENLEEEREVW